MKLVAFVHLGHFFFVFKLMVASLQVELQQFLLSNLQAFIPAYSFALSALTPAIFYPVNFNSFFPSPNSSLSHMEIFSHASPLKIQLILPPFMGSLVPSTYYLLQWPLMIDTQGCLSCSLKIAILSSLTLSSLALQHSARHSNMFKKWSLQEKKWIGRPDLIQGSLQIPPAGLAWRQEVYGPRRASRSHE